MGSPQEQSIHAQEGDLLACCVASYSHPLARWLLGDSLHPGGLGLTTRLAGVLQIGPGSTVLDAGSGRGASAVHLAATTGCRVVAVTAEQEGVANGLALAHARGVADRVTFLQDDIRDLPISVGPVDTVVMECVLSILPDKDRALRHLTQLLRPGGRLGLTDVTLNGALPASLESLLATAGCVAGAGSLDGYQALVEDAGLAIEYSQSLPEVASGFVRDLSGKLMIAEAAAGLGRLPVDKSLVADARHTLREIRALVAQGTLGYGMVVGRA